MSKRKKHREYTYSVEFTPPFNDWYPPPPRFDDYTSAYKARKEFLRENAGELGRSYTVYRHVGAPGKDPWSSTAWGKGIIGGGYSRINYSVLEREET